VTVVAASTTPVSGVSVTAGQTITITASSGTVTSGSASYEKNKTFYNDPQGILVYVNGQQKGLLVFNTPALRVDISGQLSFLYNDGYKSDNSGSYTLTYTVC
jgi:hypothetical protein